MHRTRLGAGQLPVLCQVKMLCLRLLQRLNPVLPPRAITGARGVTSQVTPQAEEVLVKMDNPYTEPQKGCVLCHVTVDFKNTQLLSQFVSPHTGRIYGRHITGLCGRKQRQVTKAIKKAQAMGFMPVTLKHPQFMKDPNICGIKQLD